MNKTQVALAVLFGISNLSLFGQRTMSFPKARITVHVTDHDGQPVQAANVGIAGTMDPRSDEVARGSTSKNGIFSAEVRTNGGIATSARKDGYYDTFGPEYRFEWGQLEKAFVTGRLESSNPTIELTLNKIISPIPMYARRFNKGIPAPKEHVGFDLSEGDYVTPYGHGKTVDIIFKLEVYERANNDYDYLITVSFPNEQDGIAQFPTTPSLFGSDLRSPYAAPNKGLSDKWIQWRSRRPGSGEYSNYSPEMHGYFFRVRTVSDASGNIVSANYGKIYGDFMNFTYYLNPTPNDRNIEFDPKQNLFTNLKPDERVTAP